jgi:hypothetical protein
MEENIELISNEEAANIMIPKKDDEISVLK